MLFHDNHRSDSVANGVDQNNTQDLILDADQNFVHNQQVYQRDRTR